MNDHYAAVAETSPAPTSLALGAPRPMMNALAEAEVHRTVAEMQAAIYLAKQFPRNELRARDQIIAACTRVSLAEAACYSYTRGGSEVTGPTIRIAEAIAQIWGNIKFGISELSQQHGESTVKAFAWDLESGTHRDVTFQVPHIRYSKSKGLERLTDPRDIYELVANQGARRLRACILAVIRGDIVEAAMQQCDETLKNAGGAPAEQVKKLLAGFAELGVSAEAVAHKLGHRLDSVNQAEVLRLRKIYRGIREGYTTATAEFAQQEQQAAEQAEQQPPKTAREAARRAAGRRPVPPQPEPPINAATPPEPAEEPETRQDEPLAPKRPRRSYAMLAEAIQIAARDEDDDTVGPAIEALLAEGDALPGNQAAELRQLAHMLLGKTP